jgi:hypothetical protein
VTDHWAILPWVNNPVLTGQAIDDLLAQSLPGVRILVVGQGTSKEDREWLDKAIDIRGDHRVLAWHWNPQMPSLSGLWNKALQFVWDLGGTEALVINNDTRTVPKTYERLLYALQHRDAWFVSAVGKSEREWTGDLWKHWIAVEPGPTDMGGPDFSCYLIAKAGHDKYPFDESLMPAFTEDCCAHREYMLGGDGSRIFSINQPYLHYASQTIKTYSPEQRRKFDQQYQRVVARYTELWGGRPNEETYVVKGDPSSARQGVTNPDLQRRVQAGEPALAPEA